MKSVLSIRLNTEPEDRALSELCQWITDRINRVLQYNPTFLITVGVLGFVTSPPNFVLARVTMDVAFFHGVLDNSPVAHRLRLSRIIYMVYVIWRKGRVKDPSTILHPFWIFLLGGGLGTSYNDQSLVTI